MVITFQEKERKQRHWLVAFIIIIIFAIFLLVYFYFFKNQKAPIPSITYKPPKIEINFETFKNPFLKELLPYEEIKPFEEKVGRENPFEPY